MAKVKASLPQGTRDFSAEVVRKRNYIFNTIRSVFELYGFQPLETPAMENLETLMGKYGEEGDKLIFRILNNGLDRVEKHQKAREDFEKVLDGKNVEGITERALRYDLTIPFARYVAMNSGQLTLPFKRYQIQPVWRADRPQKGRYREFYQCDADVVGSTSLLNEVELVNIYAEAFKKLGIEVTIKINNRKVLAALAELCGGADKMADITIAIDKLDKIGMDKVKEELAQRGLAGEQIATIAQYLAIEHDTDEGKLKELENLIGHIEIGKKGVEELRYVYNFCSQQSKINNLQYDFTLARGLNYYTGTILEIKADNVQMGSIGGGGRYDDLTGLFGVPNLPGVGISFGVDRIYDVMEELKLFPELQTIGTTVLLYNYGLKQQIKALEVAKRLRIKNISCEVYPSSENIDKQFKYAQNKRIPFIIIVDENELSDGTCTIRDLRKRTRTTMQIDAIENYPFLEQKKGSFSIDKSDFIFKTLNKYFESRNRTAMGDNIIYGKSEAIGAYTEHLFARYLNNNFSPDYKFILGKLITFRDQRFYPDIIVSKDNVITNFIELKFFIDPKGIKNRIKRDEAFIENVRNNFVNQNSEKNSSELQNLYVSDLAKYHYVIITVLHDKLSYKTQYLNYPSNTIQFYFLSQTESINLQKPENLNSLHIDFSEFDRLIENLKK